MSRIMIVNTQNAIRWDFKLKGRWSDSGDNGGLQEPMNGALLTTEEEYAILEMGIEVDLSGL